MKKIIAKVMVVTMVVAGAMCINWSNLFVEGPSLQEAIEQGIIEARANN